MKANAHLNPVTAGPACRTAFGAICVALLFLNLWGTFYHTDLRSTFSKQLLSYQSALDRTDRAWATFGASQKFLEKATRIYAKAIEYKWPSGLARVSFTDNWILATAAYLDPAIKFVGLKKDTELFSQFESYRYERALGRGFGICSQNALGFADLLSRKYAINIHVVGLDGHVVTQADTTNGKILLDPSLGVVVPMGLEEAEKKPELLQTIYEKTRDPEAARAYNTKGNFISPLPGARGYSKSQYGKQEIIRYFERAADLLKWIVPLAALALLIALGRRPKVKAQ